MCKKDRRTSDVAVENGAGNVNRKTEAPVEARTCFGTVELIMSGLVFGLFNNVSTILNAKILFESGHYVAGGLTVLFLYFPGIVTSIGFLLLKWYGHKKIGRMPPISAFFLFLFLFFCYPLVPIFL